MDLTSPPMNTEGESAYVREIQRSVEGEIPNARRNEKRNPNQNHETIALGLFSHEILKRGIKR